MRTTKNLISSPWSTPSEGQLYFLHQQETEQSKVVEIQEDDLDRSVEKILEALDMRKYYPQKLKYEDVIMLSSDVHNDVNKKPTRLAELPWFFMKHIIGLGSDTRENSHVLHCHDEGSDNDEDGGDKC